MTTFIVFAAVYALFLFANMETQPGVSTMSTEMNAVIWAIGFAAVYALYIVAGMGGAA